jgi:hypothetical protein
VKMLSDLSFRIVGFIGLTILALGQAGASSIIYVPDPDHNKSMTNFLIADFVNLIDSDDLDKFNRVPGVEFIYTNQLGLVEYQERADFLRSVNWSDGKADKEPIKISSIKLVFDDKKQPIYAVTLERQRWFLKGFEQNDMLLYDEVDRPGYRSDYSTWLVTFRGGGIVVVREAEEFSKLAWSAS